MKDFFNRRKQELATVAVADGVHLVAFLVLPSVLLAFAFGWPLLATAAAIGGAQLLLAGLTWRRQYYARLQHASAASAMQDLFQRRAAGATSSTNDKRPGGYL